MTSSASGSSRGAEYIPVFPPRPILAPGEIDDYSNPLSDDENLNPDSKFYVPPAQRNITPQKQPTIETTDTKVTVKSTWKMPVWLTDLFKKISKWFSQAHFPKIDFSRFNCFRKEPRWDDAD